MVLGVGAVVWGRHAKGRAEGSLLHARPLLTLSRPLLGTRSDPLPAPCRRCYEVRCDPRSQVKDGYGNSWDRSGDCKAGDATVVVRTVDACERAGWGQWGTLRAGR